MFAEGVKLERELSAAQAENARLKEVEEELTRSILTNSELCNQIREATKARDEALAACGEMRAALAVATTHLPEDRQAILSALSSQHGQGWKSPEEVNALEEDRDSWERQSERLDEHNDKLRLEVVALRAEVGRLEGEREIEDEKWNSLVDKTDAEATKWWKLYMSTLPERDTALSRATSAEEKCGRLEAIASGYQESACFDPEEAKRLVAQCTKLKDALILVKSRWTFDNSQCHTHTWHDWADCIAKIEQALSQPESVGVPQQAASGEELYPCDECSTMRTKAEGGTTFTVCDECWDRLHPKPTHSQSSNDKATITKP